MIVLDERSSEDFLFLLARHFSPRYDVLKFGKSLISRSYSFALQVHYCVCSGPRVTVYRDCVQFNWMVRLAGVKGPRAKAKPILGVFGPWGQGPKAGISNPGPGRPGPRAGLSNPGPRRPGPRAGNFCPALGPQNVIFSNCNSNFHPFGQVSLSSFFRHISSEKKILQRCIFAGSMWTKLPLTASGKFWMVFYIFKISKSWKLGIVYQQSYESPTPPFVTKYDDVKTWWLVKSVEFWFHGFK
jgi:hypothetical protein